MDSDDLARTAARLLSTVEHDSDDKFQNSQFLSLMRKLRDRQAEVQGTNIVDRDDDAVVEQPALRSSPKGKQREMPMNAKEAMMQDVRSGIATSVPQDTLDTYMQDAEPYARTQDYMSSAYTADAAAQREMDEMWADEVNAAGGICVVTGLAGFVLVALTGAPAFLVAVCGTILGVGMGLGSTGVSVLVLHLAPRSQHAQASSAMSLADTLGATVGLAVTGTLYASLAAAGPTPHAFALLWAACAAAGVVALLAGVRSRRPARRR